MSAERRIGLALALAGAFVVPVFFPPGPLPSGQALQSADLLARLFPGVPAWWVVARLGCLLAAAALVAGGTGPTPTAAFARRSSSRPPSGPAALLWVAFVWALAHFAAGFGARGFPRGAQLAYVAALGGPFLILQLGPRWRGNSAAAGRSPWTLGVVAAWLLYRVPASLHSARSADVVDTWEGWRYLLGANRPDFNLLTQGFFPGLTGLHLVPQGAGIFAALGTAPEWAWVQAIHFFWLSVSALALAGIVRRLASPPAALVAVAVFLFSPFALMIPLTPSPLFIGPAYASLLGYLLLRVHLDRSILSLAALGAIAGLGASQPSTLLVSAVALAAAVLSACTGNRLPRPAVAIAVLSFAAAVLPGLPDLEAVGGMYRSYAERQWQWGGLETLLLGQRSPHGALFFQEAGRAGTLDIPLATLLAPFATPRTPIRLWGDVFIEPIGAALAAMGIALCARSSRRSFGAQALLAAFAVALLPGLVSSFDRPSLTRIGVAPLIVAVFAGVGFEALRARLAPRHGSFAAALAVGTLIAASGAVLFDVINPRILPASSTGIALEMRQATQSTRDAILLDHGSGALEFLHARTIAARVPASPIAVREAYEALETDETAVLLWSPGLEEDRDVTERLCDRWPKAKLYSITDRAGVSRLHAADRAETEWSPPLAASRWSAESCPRAGAG